MILHDRGEAVHDERGDVVRFAGLTSDMTDMRQLEEQLRHAQKMESLGRLAGGVAHEVNNLLTILLGHARLARQSPGVGRRAHRRHRGGGAPGRRAHGAAARAHADAADPRGRHRARGPDAVRGARAARGGRARLQTLRLECPPERLPVRADAAQLRRMLGELVRNAAESMPGGGRLDVVRRAGGLRRGRDGPASGLVPGEHVVLRITDAGMGIPEADRSRVFEPFFTTKRGAPGMGLTTAYGIIARCGGHIALESVAGRGTVRQLLLPARGRRGDARALARALAGDRRRAGASWWPRTSRWSA